MDDGQRPETRREAGIGPQAKFVPQTHLPGTEAEADFGEVSVVLAGQMTRLSLFSLRLSYSGKAVHGSSRPQARKPSA